MKTEIAIAVILFSTIVYLAFNQAPLKQTEPKVVIVKVPEVKEVIKEVPVEKIVVKEIIREVPVVKRVIVRQPEVILPYNQRPCFHCRPPTIMNPHQGGVYEYNNRSRYRQLYPRRYYFQYIH